MRVNNSAMVLGNQIAGGIAAAAIGYLLIRADCLAAGWVFAGVGLCRISLGLWLLLNLAFGE